MLLPNPNIEAIEKAILSLHETDDQVLEVWSQRRGITSFCAEAALLQFVITWARKKESSCAHFQDFSGDQPDFEKALGC